MWSKWNGEGGYYPGWDREEWRNPGGIPKPEEEEKEEFLKEEEFKV